MSAQLNIFDLDPRVAPIKPLQVIWWNSDMEYISRITDCVKKSVVDVKNSFNDIPWFCKGHEQTNRAGTDDGEKRFNEVRSADLSSSIGTVTRLKLTHVFSTRFYLWWYDRAQGFLISGEIFNWERHIKKYQIIIIILSKKSTYPVNLMWNTGELSDVRGCQWFLCK